MRRFPGFLIGLMVLTCGSVRAANAQEIASTTSVVTYIEVLPGSAGRVPAALRSYREATRREGGILRLDVLQRLGRDHHFAIVESWKDQEALDAHRQAAHVTQFRNTLQSLQAAPLDERLLRGVAVGPVSAAPSPGGALYVLTHADAIAAARANDALRPLAEASRGETGNLQFDVLNQPTRQNHFTIVEVWRNQQAFDAHVAAAHTRTFRDQFQMFTGSLYDERLYKRLE